MRCVVCGERGRAYGPVRLWGSAAFIAGSFGAGLALDVMARAHLIWLIVVTPWVSRRWPLALARWLPMAAGQSPATRCEAARAGACLRSPAFLAVAPGRKPHSGKPRRLLRLLRRSTGRPTGLDGGTIGALWALGVVAEIALFAVSGRLAARSDGAAAPGRRAARSCAGSQWRSIRRRHCCRSCSACTRSRSARPISARWPMLHAGPCGNRRDRARLLAVAQGLAMAGAMGVSGLLYARYGAGALWRNGGRGRRWRSMCAARRTGCRARRTRSRGDTLNGRSDTSRRVRGR